MKKNNFSGDDATMELRGHYRDALRRRTIELRAFAERCREGRVMAAEFEEIHMRVRSLAGSGAMYGYAELGEMAMPLDRALQSPSGSGLKKLAKLADHLAAACEKALSAEPASATILPFPKPPAPEAGLPYPVILIVDDDPAMHDLLGAMFKGNAHIVSAYNGVEALDAMRRHCPDLVLLDQYMPDMDGLHLLERMSEDRAMASMPVIMLTAGGRTDEIMRAAMAGIADYVAKPFDPNMLGDKISGFMKRLRTTVLIANGNTMMREMVADKLRRMGFHVLESADGKQTLEMAATRMPELIVLDQSMQDMDGRAVLHELRENKRTRHIPTLYLSVNSLGQSVVEGLNIGAADQAVMPFIPEKVTARILKALDAETA